jgi:hypothetical protein
MEMVQASRDYPEYGEWLPDFLGIGAQKAGTTWLYRNLRQHPEIWLPPIKELHYFNRLYPASPSPLTTTPLFLRPLSRQRSDQLWRRELTRAFLNIRRMSLQESCWHFRFFFAQQYNDRWYASLFKDQVNRVTGEITPAYSILEDQTIEHIHTIMPQARITFIIRNPIERAWSAARTGIRQLGRKGRIELDGEGSHLLEALPPARLERLFQRIRSRDGYVLRGDYVRTINNWSRHFPREQFLIGFFEEIVHSPAQFLLRIFDFLQVDASTDYITDLAFKKVNPSPGKQMPPKIERLLATQYYPQIKTLSEMLGGYADQWLSEAQAILQDST